MGTPEALKAVKEYESQQWYADGVTYKASGNVRVSVASSEEQASTHTSDKVLRELDCILVITYIQAYLLTKTPKSSRL